MIDPRIDHAAAKRWAELVVPDADHNHETNPIANLARAYLARCAEVAELKERVEIAEAFEGNVLQDNAGLRARAEASEARCAEVVKALDKISDMPLGPDRGSPQWQLDCIITLARAALREPT